MYIVIDFSSVCGLHEICSQLSKSRYFSWGCKKCVMLAPCLALYEQISLPLAGLCTVTFFPVTFFPTCPLFLFPCYFFPTATLIESTELLLIFLIPAFLLGHCYFLSCYFFSYLPTVSFSLLLLSYCYPD